ncbi:hypothetical protein IQ241_04620 [Romeria aff. gracilis LEGE 07310]|uniref:Uncharacterized protein n=1 Tax=Vasconcelosia minhoensis LEGE 07310 TaxID=915328 RepID=A0A8J7A627_9CYAN|nr:hypothetical protein [Romeria gracilis]MBE9076585.1 hypothetical protein [Romeria aff. gracilis LEGE 07310]
MSILNQFLKFLEWLEAAQTIFDFLTHPIGLSAVLAVCFYFPMQILGCDAPTAATLSCTTALTMFCLLERPDF